MSQPSPAPPGAPSSSTSSSHSTSAHRSVVYALIVRQLHDDGHGRLARALSQATGVQADLSLEDHLLSTIVANHESLYGPVETASRRGGADDGDEDTALMDVEAELAAAAAEETKATLFRTKLQDMGALPQHLVKFTTTHKGPCSSAAFSRDGRYAATGSTDMSIKVLDVSRMHYHSSHQRQSGSRPVTRTLYDHTAMVNELDFNPQSTFLASCSEDRTIKFFDLSKVHAKRAYNSIVDTHAVRSIHYHPQGAFLLAGAAHPMIRVYDLEKLAAYTSQDFSKVHDNVVTCVRWAPSASVYASSSKDGSVKVWDTVSNKCVRSLDGAHGGAHVTGLCFSADSQFLLTTGLDSTLRLFDVASSRQMQLYEGAANAKLDVNCSFDYTGNFVLGVDDTGGAVHVWNTWSGERVKRFPVDGGVPRYVVASTCEPSFMTCSDDGRARFWAGTDDDEGGGGGGGGEAG